MQERVNLLGGTLRVESTPGHGTRVVARVPLREPSPIPATAGADLLEAE